MKDTKDKLTLDDVFKDPLFEEVDPSFSELKHVRPSQVRFPGTSEYNAGFTRCENFSKYLPLFGRVKDAIEEGIRKPQKIKLREEITIYEGDFFIRNGQLLLVAEVGENVRGPGGLDRRLRIVADNGLESDPLQSSFRDSLRVDKYARYIPRRGMGALDPEWYKDRPDFTGTIYVARTLSNDPAIKKLKDKIIKIGVTGGDVNKRVANAEHDPTFLNAPVKIIATYDLLNLSRTGVEETLHNFFDAGNLSRHGMLAVMDRHGKKTKPREWFQVKPELVKEAVHYLAQDRLYQYRFDLAKQELVQQDPEFSYALRHVKCKGIYPNISTFADEARQPGGGLLPLRKFTETQFEDGGGMIDRKGENNAPAIIGLTIDYLSRMQMGMSFTNAFSVTKKGALMVGVSEEKWAFIQKTFEAADIDEQIRLTCHLVTYDSAARTGSYNGNILSEPSKVCISHIKHMIKRTVTYLKSCGQPYYDGLTLLNLGVLQPKRTRRIAGGDFDGLAGETLYDLKVSINNPSSKDTLQLLTYYVLFFMKTDYQEIVKNPRYLSLFNPRLNRAWRVSVGDIKEPAQWVLKLLES